MSRKLDLNKLKDKEVKIISSEEALRDVPPWFNFPILNKRVQSYYESLQRITNNTEFTREKRMKALEKEEVVEAMVLTYERGIEFDPEENLRLVYDHILLPDEMRKIMKDMQSI